MEAEQELVACVFAASEMGIPVQPTTEETIATTTNEKARLLDLVNGSSLTDPSTLKDWLRESDAITSWPPIFLSDSIVFLIPSLSFFSEGEWWLAVAGMCPVH